MGFVTWYGNYAIYAIDVRNNFGTMSFYPLRFIYALRIKLTMMRGYVMGWCRDKRWRYDGMRWWWKLGDREASLRHIVNETMRLISRIIIPLRLRVHRLLKGVWIWGRVGIRVGGRLRLRLIGVRWRWSLRWWSGRGGCVSQKIFNSFCVHPSIH